MTSPDAPMLAGRHVDLERLDVVRQVDDLWESIGQHGLTQIPNGQQRRALDIDHHAVIQIGNEVT